MEEHSVRGYRSRLGYSLMLKSNDTENYKETKVEN